MEKKKNKRTDAEKMRDTGGLADNNPMSSGNARKTSGAEAKNSKAGKN